MIHYLVRLKRYYLNYVSQRKKTSQRIDREADDYYARRKAAKEEYRSLIASGQIRDKTRIEKVMDRANGHPDLASTQAARRMAEKMGYDWRTGKKLKK